ncbi:hypothetical protein [Sphingomonas sp. KR3-1]|uniref:hypothetical protein n=1 Tax=Sphingomonas sp. KR3-1 TaxID=3156611 RepID=UPI0032B368CF
MYRKGLIFGGLVMLVAGAAPAFAQSSPVANYGPGGTAPNLRSFYSAPPGSDIGTPPPRTFSVRVAGEIARWGDVGKCVAAKDRDTSLSYVTARRGTPEADAAAKRLAPTFDTCFASSPVARKDNEALRRAALGDALGVAAR